MLSTVTQSIVSVGLDSSDDKPENCWRSVKAAIGALVGVMQNYVRKVSWPAFGGSQINVSDNNNCIV